MDRKSIILEKLRSSGLRLTRQRIKIAEFLFKRKKTFHFTVEQMGQLINREKKEKISLATFYNTVHAFTKFGYLKEILTRNNKSFFDTNVSSHHHFFDMQKKELTDIDSKKIKLEEVPNAPSGKIVENIEVVINIKNSI